MKWIYRLIYRVPRMAWRIALVALIVAGLRLAMDSSSPVYRTEGRIEEVSLSSSLLMNEPLRKAFVQAEAEAAAFAKQQTEHWIAELRQRAEEDFYPWYFAYWNQQAMMFRSIGHKVMESSAATGLFGRQPTAQQQMEQYIEDAFLTRVLQPATARLRIESITRETVKRYLYALNDDLKAQKAAYAVHDPAWDRYLEGTAGMILAIEGNRQVPLVLKGITAGSAATLANLSRVVVFQARSLAARLSGREMIGCSMRYGGRTVFRGAGWAAFTAVCVWDLYDHHRTVQNNLPVLRRLVNGCLDELGALVLHDGERGVLVTLDTVQKALADEAERQGIKKGSNP
jgi:hypothetical protein